jgi:transposase
MPCRLSEEEIVALRVLGGKNMKKTRIAATLGVSEGTVRYHLKRQEQGAVDGRQNKPQKAAELAGVIENWFKARKDHRRPVNVLELHDYLEQEYGYEGSYKSVLRYARRHYPRPRMRTYRRVETPAGAQSQTDWAEFSRVAIGADYLPLSVFIMCLSHSRMVAVIWRTSKEQLSWLASHNEAFKRLGGVAAVNRIDNVKTAIAQGAGSWGIINQVYRAYAKAVGFHIDACQPRSPNAKGKVEAKVHLSRLRLNPVRHHFDDIEHLQQWTDQRIDRWSEQAICPATGKSVRASWEQERPYLHKVDRYPQPFDVVVSRPVGKDCLVNFEGRSYSVPFRYAGQLIEVRGCAGTVQIWADGTMQREYPRHSEERLLLDPSCYTGEATERVLPPPPLGRMGSRLQELIAMPVEQRPLDLYASLLEVAR